MASLSSSKHAWRYFLVGGVLLFFIIWSIILYILGPAFIINKIGERNSYLVACLMGFLAGSSFLASSAFYVTVFFFSRAGLNPFILGFIAAIGLTAGDLLVYFLGFQTGEIATGWLEKRVHSFGNWLKKQPPSFVVIVILVYVALTPLPNDFLMISVGLAQYRYKTIALCTFIGNVFSLIIISLLAYHGVISI